MFIKSLPNRYLRFVNAEDGRTLWLQSFEYSVPFVPCIGATIRRKEFEGIVEDVYIDYTSDTATRDCDAGLVKIRINHNVVNFD